MESHDNEYGTTSGYGPRPRQKLRILLQVNASDDSRPRWLILHCSVLTANTTPEILADTLGSLELRINRTMGWD
jgi:hypothetical protein